MVNPFDELRQIRVILREFKDEVGYDFPLVNIHVKGKTAELKMKTLIEALIDIDDRLKRMETEAA